MLTREQWNALTEQQRLDYLLSLYTELDIEQQWEVSQRMMETVNAIEAALYDSDDDSYTW